jgi:hypothetical protein
VSTVAVELYGRDVALDLAALDQCRHILYAD